MRTPFMMLLFRNLKRKLKMLHHFSDQEPDDPYDEFIIKEADEEEEAEKLMEIENELYSYVHYSSQNDFETETVDPKVWISLEKENSAVNRPLMRRNENGDKKKAEDIVVTKTYKCSNCSLVGHLSRDCRQMKQIVCYICGILGHISRNCPNRICFNCERLGHVARDCNEKRRLCDVYCLQCNMMGHKDYDCPDLWRRYHVTTKEGPIVKLRSQNPRVYCYNCGVCGHFAHECHKPTMYKHVQPPYPFVISYKSNLKTKKKSQKTRKSMKIIVGYDKIPVKKQKIAKDETKVVKNKIKKKRQMTKKITAKIKKSKIANKNGSLM